MAGEARCRRSRRPDRFRGPGAGPHRPFCRLISGSCATGAAASSPRLIELQAFPSLYGFQTLVADAYRDTYAIAPEWSAYLSGLNAESYA